MVPAYGLVEVDTEIDRISAFKDLSRNWIQKGLDLSKIDRLFSSTIRKGESSIGRGIFLTFGYPPTINHKPWNLQP